MEIKVAVCDDDIKDLAKLHALVGYAELPVGDMII